MLSVIRSFVRPRSVVSVAALGTRRSLVVTTKLCTEDAIVSRPAVKEDNKDLLRSSIRLSKTMGQLQNVIQQHTFVMNSTHLMLCMVQYTDLNKKGETDIPPTEDPVFQSLSKTVLSKMRFFGTKDCIQLAWVAAELKLDASCSLVQGICQMLRKRLNELDLDHIMALRRILQRLEGSSVLTDTLTLSLPLVFETQVKRQLDPDNEAMCVKALQYSMSNDLSAETQNYVAQTMSRFLPELSAENAASLIYSAAFRKDADTRPLGLKTNIVLKQCLVIVAQNLSQFDGKSVRRLLAAFQHLRVFSRELLDACWALAPAWTFPELMILVSVAIERDAILMKDAKLLESLLPVLQTEVENATPMEVSKLAEVMSQLAVQLTHLDSRLTNIGNFLATALERNGFSEYPPHRLTRLMLHLATLDVYPEEALSLLFSEKYQRAILEESKRYVMERLLDLERLLHLRFGDGCPYVVMPELRETAMRPRSTFGDSDDLTKSLETALGGDQFLLKRMGTPLGVVADLGVVMRQGEYPIALANKEFPLEGLPKDCKVVGILQCVMLRDITRGADMLRVPFALKNHFLRAQGICPVTIRMDQWYNLHANEKIPYLMTKIKDALLEGQSYSQQQEEECM